MAVQQPSTPTLKPSMRAALEQDHEAATQALTDPKMAPYIQNKAALAREVQAIKRTLDEQSPRKYETPQELDAAVKLERQLREQFCEGIPS